jgi:hypothetical protein
MTEVQDAKERRVKWLRYAARILGVLWALFYTLVGWSWYSMYWYDYFRFTMALIFLVVAFVAWVSIAIAWRWEGIGGVLLLVEGLLISLLSLWPLTHEPGALVALAVLVALAMPPLIIGILFLVSWRKSRTPARPKATQ